MSSTPPEQNGITTLLGPLRMLSFSAYYIPVTIFNLATTFQFSKLGSWSAFQHAWFGTFWGWFGPMSRENATPVVEPLLRNAAGVVLDIGPGSGEWLRFFSPDKNAGIERIYGVEPNREHHDALRRRVREAGLEGVYEILGVGVEDLASCGLHEESIDTICTVQCLCSVPGPQKIVKELFPYLKPGGKWLVYEHVRTKYTGEFVDYWQSEYF